MSERMNTASNLEANGPSFPHASFDFSVSVAAVIGLMTARGSMA